MVDTVIVTVAGAAPVTVTGTAGAEQVAFVGAPVQVTVTLIWSVGSVDESASCSEKLACWPAFTVAEVEPLGAAPIVKLSPAVLMVCVKAAEMLLEDEASPE